MAFLTARLSVLAAVALVTVAQVVVAPAACCVLKAAVFGGEPCCSHATVSDAAPSCCHQHAPDVAAVGESDPVPASNECLWCSSDPKISSSDRVVPPVAEPATLPAAAVEPTAVSALAFAEHSLEEPFHRTALASCAWLCVWRK